MAAGKDPFWMNTIYRACAFASLVVLACGSQSTQTTEAHLGGAAVARVGSTEISSALVEAVATAQNTSPRAALALLVDDATLAEAARARKIDTRTDVAGLLRSRAAGQCILHVQAQAEAAGPATTAELAAMRKTRWAEFDRPAGVRVIHALVKKPKHGPWDVAAATEEANALRTAVAASTSPEDFEGLAKGVVAKPYEIHVESLSPFALDGRVILETQGSMDGTFAKAAFALSPGQLSPIVSTTFGLHVIRAVERFEAVYVDDAMLRERARTDLLRERAQKLFDEALTKRRATVVPAVEPAAGELMGLLFPVPPSP